MTGEPTLEDAVDSWAAEDDNTDRMIELVAQYGEYDDQSLNQRVIDVQGEDDIWVYTGEDLPDDVFDTVTAFVREYRPGAKQCYANAAELARYDDRFDYVDGVTASEETGNVHDHAWNCVDGVPVDVTRNSRERYGVHVPNSVLREVLPVFESVNQWNLLTNEHVDTRFKPPYSDETN